MSGVFSNTEIKEALKSGQIVIHPYVESNVNTTSVDVRLGEHYWRLNDRRDNSLLFNPFNEEQVASHFQQKQAIRLSEALKNMSLSDTIIFPTEDKDPLVIPLMSGERILGHTYEFIGAATNGTTMMQARSTVGRSGIEVCSDAGWGDTGYVNRWTMEIHNKNEHQHVLLPVGWRIAQLVFFHAADVSGEYSSDTGKYQTSSAIDLETMIKKWHPKSMLPKAHLDRIGSYKPLSCDKSNRLNLNS